MAEQAATVTPGTKPGGNVTWPSGLVRVQVPQMEHGLYCALVTRVLNEAKSIDVNTLRKVLFALDLSIIMAHNITLDLTGNCEISVEDNR
jgi:hypothetical protein